MTVAQTSAREILKAAYDNRYTWDNNFPGYTADVTYKYEDKEFKGKVRVNPNLKAEVFDIEDEQAKEAINNQLWEIAIHRIRREFEDSHKDNTFSEGETDESGAVEVLVGGKASGDKYKIRDREVVLVHRHIHGVVVTINTESTHDTGEGYLAHRYDSVYHDPTTGEQKGGKSDFEDKYEKVGDYSILNERIITTEVEGKPVTMQFIFSNIQMLG
ncbi:MAG: DUF3386 domain-containing protein [Richelia sp. RM2_1_2]|nr:DUF3386 domain-containing protein [Richelia sp. SM2_1_7]NJM20619.1 DUF3386 domain-containing protein [Richelia sp. SM1_7_0]NJN13765.1 DUF3386 domain-containing protein [Richelia sp. RM1_1_1]NJO29179.1 DUF3386 domain-containing protein [Richelia sp. SL_2_1]NJO65504.1 DUF3386 domain-containing protein [Richelia sp. RM2_1_2]